MQNLDRTHFEALAANLMEQPFERVPKMREFHCGRWTERGGVGLRKLTSSKAL